MRQWRLIYDCPSSGAHHMAVDEAILACGSGQPTLRLYAWMPFCLSLGYGQHSADADLDRLAAAGYDLVRRPTGGRAILHGDELTYSIVLPPGHPLGEGGILPSYRRISQALVAGLQTLGVRPNADDQAGPGHSGPVCFETPSHYEVTVRGRKLIGSAQLRRGGGILQHGSLPLQGDLGRICDVLAYADESERKAGRAQVCARAITLSEALGVESTAWQTAAQAVVAGFQETFDIELEVGDLTKPERAQEHQLTAERYASPDWTFRR